MTKILHTTTLKPQYTYTTDEVIEAADKYWLKDLKPKFRKAALMLFKAAEIENRNLVQPIELVLSDLSFEEKNNIYKEIMIDMGTRVLKKAIEESGINPKEIGTIITTSCTGFMIPSVDAYMINRLGLKTHINRLPVTEMGCAGGTSGLIYAHQFLTTNPNQKIALVSIETPSLTLQKHDMDMENLVSSSIFADGASCVILGHTDEIKPTIIDTDMYHFPDGEYLMGYNLQNSGLKIVLNRDVPDTITEHFPKILHPFLKKNNLTPKDVENFMFHPGGKKIINMVINYMNQYNKDVSESLDVLKQHGNMSSSTILHILERFMKKDINAGEKGYMLAFGPGFMAQSLLLEWR